MRYKMQLKIVLKKIFVVILTLVLSAAILEIGLRIIGKTPSNTTGGIAEQNGNSYRLIKNAEKDINWPAYSYTVYTNSFGFRDKSIGERDITNNSYYVFLGASEVFGNGVDYEDTFVGIIDEYASKYSIKVLNIAIGGHYFKDQEMLLKDFIANAKKKPKKVFFCVNALHIPKFDMRNDHLRVINGALFNRDRWKIAFVRMMIGNTSSAYCFFRDNIRKIQSKYFNFMPTEKSNEFLGIYSKSNRMHDISNVARFEAYLDSFNKYCYKNDIIPIYIYTPITDSYRLAEILNSVGEDIENYDTSYYVRLMANYCKRKKIRFINLRPVLQQYHDQKVELRFKLDPHYNKNTNRNIGEFLINEIFKTK
jgi:hypothetical protein